MRNWSDAERAAERARMKGGQVLSGWSRVVLLREMRVVSASLKLSPTFRIMRVGKELLAGGSPSQIVPILLRALSAK